MKILETRFDRREQNVYLVNENLQIGAKGWYRWVTQQSVFFHRHAKDRIKYNRTNLRQFTRHTDDDDATIVSLEAHNCIANHYEVETLDMFFRTVRFNYATKSWLHPQEVCMRFNPTTLKYE